ncbi:MAG TPA: carboxy terminal-processing peptidase [Lacibacter sp.]|nr:carboxy terminal-processing peptidase [Lacibacter sp.]
MFSKKSLFIILLLVLGGSVFYAVQSSSAFKNPGTRYERILQLVGEMLVDGHFSPRKMDDKFSRDVVKNFLKNLDPDKSYFLAADIEKIRAYETRIDDELKGATLESFFTINELYKQRVKEASLLYKEILKKPFDFTVEESYNEDFDKIDYARNENAWKENWRRKLKYYTLERYADLLEQKEKSQGKENPITTSNADLEKQARERVERSFDRIFERFRNRLKDDDRFNVFVNTITETMDPHTTYFAPVERRSFDEQMSGEFYGIGASLMEEDGNIKIVTIVTGSPAYKSGEIQIGDYIIKVAQGDQEPQDLTGFAVDDAVKLIRGKKGTEVRITLKKPDGTTRVVTMIREKINLEEVFAKSAVITDENGYKIGYIYLPEFYANFQDPNGARCAADVAKEIQKLKKENVSGIIMDLRNNGGGSLMDVVQMVGLFIEDGPIVQVKSRDESPSILRDRDNSVLWNGPLVVMVNQFSASASEIFAAAIQDYRRGLVIGSTSTYGKGTVQRNIELERTSWVSTGGSDLGSIKLTLQKFYRITGGSTQLKGVTSDIVLPDQYEYLKLREKDDPKALAWDEIGSVQFKSWKQDYDLRDIVKRGNQRVAENKTFQSIRENSGWLEKYDRRVHSLKLETFLKNKKQLGDAISRFDNLTRLTDPLKIENLQADMSRISQDSFKIERNNSFLRVRKNDLYLGETVTIMGDMIRQYFIVQTDPSGRATDPRK